MQHIKLPIGYSNFGEIRREGLFYADKTQLCEDLFNDKKKAILITRPRRFGKTLNLSMVEHFFSKQVQGYDTAKLFHGTQITKQKDFCKNHQGKYPVIFFSLKGINTQNFSLALGDIRENIVSLYNKFGHILESDKLSSTDKIIFQNTLCGKLDQSQLQKSLQRLTQFVNTFYDVKPILLIDEYDVPIQGAYLNDFYQDMVSFIKVFLSDAIKDADHITRTLITGVTRVSKESIFSGVNNLVVYSLYDERYSQYFGFVENEVRTLVEKSQVTIDFNAISKWYNGYLSGNTILYNPWSILSVIDNNGKFNYYWVNTSGNEILEKIIHNGLPDFYDCLKDLINDKPINQLVDPHVVFKDVDTNTAAIWSLLFNTGYLKITQATPHFTSLNCQLKIPNLEVKGLFFNIINKWVNGTKGPQWYQNFLTAILKGDINTLSQNLQDILLNITSFHDTANPSPEKFYHGLLIGLSSGLCDTYTIKSNRESGTGRSDILLIPLNPIHPAYIFELKKSDEKKLSQTAQKALNQITQNTYNREFANSNVKQYFEVGIAFSNKKLAVAHHKKS